MARIKYYNTNTGQWEYADSAFSNSPHNDAKVFVGDANTTVTEFYEAFISGKTCFIRNPYEEADDSLWILSGVDERVANFYTITSENVIRTMNLYYDGSANGVKYNLPQLLSEKVGYNQLPNAINNALEQAKKNGVFDGEIFVGDANTTVTEFYEAFISGKACFIRNPYNEADDSVWVLSHVDESVANFYIITYQNIIRTFNLYSDGTSNGVELNLPGIFGDMVGSKQMERAIDDAVKGKLDATALPTAVNDALAQAKASGEFDGKDGKDGAPGADGYTPVKGVDYFDGQPGADGKDGADGDPGKDGKDGVTPHVGSNGNWFIGDNDTGIPATGPAGGQGLPGTPGENGKDGNSATHSWNGTVLTITSASGTSSADLKGEKGDKGDNGDKGDTGAAGASVTVKSVSESTADGGSNVVSFSDGKTLTIKNGSKGSKGDTGATGQRGTGLLAVTTAPSSYTTAVGGITPKYRMAISTIKTQANATEVLLGDTVRYSYYHYPIAYLDASYAYFTTRVSIRGATGADGKDYVLTEADKAEIVAMVIESIGGNPIFGIVDENNNIIVNGNLPDGTYSVKYEMENGTTVNIGNLVLDTNVYYTVTNNLTNCVSNNSAAKAVQGGSYSATITAKSGYELKSIVVKMGGTDVSASAVSGGNITIANVTGNIVITAVAEETKTVTNFAEPNATNTSDWSIWINNARAGSDGTYRSDTAGDSGKPIVTNYIAVQNGDVVEFSGIYTAPKNTVLYKSDKSVLKAGTLTSATNYLSGITEGNTNREKGGFTINNANVAYVRIGGYIKSNSDGSDVVINIKRNGEYL